MAIEQERLVQELCSDLNLLMRREKWEEEHLSNAEVRGKLAGELAELVRETATSGRMHGKFSPLIGIVDGSGARRPFRKPERLTPEEAQINVLSGLVEKELPDGDEPYEDAAGSFFGREAENERCKNNLPGSNLLWEGWYRLGEKRWENDYAEIKQEDGNNVRLNYAFTPSPESVLGNRLPAAIDMFSAVLPEGTANILWRVLGKLPTLPLELVHSIYPGTGVPIADGEIRQLAVKSQKLLNNPKLGDPKVLDLIRKASIIDRRRPQEGLYMVDWRKIEMTNNRGELEEILNNSLAAVPRMVDNKSMGAEATSVGGVGVPVEPREVGRREERVEGYPMDTASGVNKGVKRDYNQDRLKVTEFGGNVRGMDGFYILVDGMGGHANGEAAAEAAVKAIEEEVLGRKFLGNKQSYVELSNEERIVWLREITLAANEKVKTAAAPDGGSTVVWGVREGNRVDLVWAGDSRAGVVGKDGKLRWITRDHSLVGALVEGGQITGAEARKHPQRNVIYRNLGDRKRECQPGFESVMIPEGGSLVLCSDGLWEMVGDDEVGKIVAGAGSSKKAVNRLIETANRNGGEDNISVIVVGNKVKEKAPEIPQYTDKRACLGYISDRAGRIAESLRRREKESLSVDQKVSFCRDLLEVEAMVTGWPGGLKATTKSGEVVTGEEILKAVKKDVAKILGLG